MVVNDLQLSCWRAHPCGISSVRCAAVSGMQGQDLLLVASQDCTVSLWSLQGGLVGVMGKHTWTLSDPSTWQDAKVGIPPCMYSQSSGQVFVSSCAQNTCWDADAFMLIVVCLFINLCTLVSHIQAVRCCQSNCFSISL